MSWYGTTQHSNVVSCGRPVDKVCKYECKVALNELLIPFRIMLVMCMIKYFLQNQLSCKSITCVCRHTTTTVVLGWPCYDTVFMVPGDRVCTRLTASIILPHKGCLVLKRHRKVCSHSLVQTQSQ